MTIQKHILLESGTNELELLEFVIGNRTYGINVLKVREIIENDTVTKLPKSSNSIEGVIVVRGETMLAINLPNILEGATKENEGKKMYIVTEFNQLRVAFLVETVKRISRVSWTDIEKPSKIFDGNDGGSLIGVIKREDEVTFLLDFEKIIVDISPSSGINKESAKTVPSRSREKYRIILVEDSIILRKLISETLIEAGYSNLVIFHDGLEAWEHLETSNGENNHYDLIVTDVEMAKMDGHHLTKKIKNHPRYKHLPVIIFSSLITDDLYHKGQAVGADAQISKPDIKKLVEVVDQFVGL